MHPWPVLPMLARLTRRLPGGDVIYEPKWDGFRCLVRRAGDEVDMRSRNLKPLSRYFPELVEAFRGLDDDRFTVDGEIVVCSGDRFDFPALLARLHPAPSRVERLSRDTPASFVAFDALATAGADLTAAPAARRRACLEDLLRRASPPLFLTPATDDVEVATSWLGRFTGNGIDGIVAKPKTSTYQPGKRALAKVKVERTADCVVGGMRVFAGVPLVASLLLGLYDEQGVLRHVGVASSFTDVFRSELFEELSAGAVELAGHPWEHGFNLGPSPLGRLKGAAARWTSEAEADWVPVAPERVCEVTFDQWEGDRFRHPARFRRWRPDRDPASCTFDQIEIAEPAPLGDILTAP